MWIFIFFIIYLVGYIIAYILLRNDTRRVLLKNNKKYTYKDVIDNICYSTMSWLILIFILFDTIGNFIKELKFKEREPPKWL